MPCWIKLSISIYLIYTRKKVPPTKPSLGYLCSPGISSRGGFVSKDLWRLWYYCTRKTTCNLAVNFSTSVNAFSKKERARKLIKASDGKVTTYFLSLNLPKEKIQNQFTFLFSMGSHVPTLLVRSQVIK